MRLLRRESDGKVSFTRDMFESDAFELKYAILSHTWTYDGEEISYEDMIQGSISKQGYRKIQFCIDQTSRDGLEYFWIDTCCIKEDQSERAASMLSMYRWYANAEKCYVYLSDSSNSEECILRDCRWFTRGWTVLELVAPTIVEFFHQGSYVGSKSTLEIEISNITGIPISALRGKALCEYTVDERKMWHSGRQTKEPEDMVYSLLSLLEISMPIIPNEGLECAEQRFFTALSSRYSSFSDTPEHSNRRLEEAKAMYERAMRTKEAHLCSSHVSTLDTLHNIGVAYRRLEKFNKAEEILLKVLKLRETMLGVDDILTIETAHELGRVYARQEKFSKAEELLLRALQEREKVLGSNDDATLDTVMALGRYYRTIQNFERAEHFIQRAYKSYSVEPRSKATLAARLESSILHHTQWRLAECENEYRAILQVYEQELGAGANETLHTRTLLGSVLRAGGLMTQSSNLYRLHRAYIAQSVLDEEGKAKIEEGNAMYRRSAKAYELRSVDNFYSNVNMAVLGHSLITSDDSHLAEQGAKICQSALEKLEKIVGSCHTTTLATRVDLASYKMNHGKLEEAEKDLLVCLDEHIKHLGTLHTATMRVRFSLAKLYKKQGREEAREEMLVQLLKDGEAAFGLQHRFVIIAVSNLYFLYVNQGRKEEARNLFFRVDAGYKTADPGVQAFLDTIRVILPSKRQARSKKSTKKPSKEPSKESSKESSNESSKKSCGSGWKRSLAWWPRRNNNDDPPPYTEKAAIS